MARSATVAEFSGVINMAAWAGVRASVKNPWIYVDSNMTGTLNMLELCHQSGTKKFIVASNKKKEKNHALLAAIMN